MRKAAVFFAAFLIWCSTSSAMWAQDWVVQRVAQPAQYTLDSIVWSSLSVGTILPEGSWIMTGNGGRLTLSRGHDVIHFRPRTIASISSQIENSINMTTVKQKFGTLLFDVETGPTWHFRIETPFLAAVVKGTRFTVGVRRDRSQVSVMRGRVQVTDINRGLQTDLSTDQSVNVVVDQIGVLQIDGPGLRAAVLEVPPSEPTVSPAVTLQEALDSGIVDDGSSNPALLPPTDAPTPPPLPPTDVSIPPLEAGEEPQEPLLDEERSDIDPNLSDGASGDGGGGDGGDGGDLGDGNEPGDGASGGDDDGGGDGGDGGGPSDGNEPGDGASGDGGDGGSPGDGRDPSDEASGDGMGSEDT